MIRCPQCHFDREINTDQIPPNAVIATCPQCGTRFRFRTLDTALSGEDQEYSASDAENTAREASGNAGGENTFDEDMPDDGLPPGAIIFPSREESRNSEQEKRNTEEPEQHTKAAQEDAARDFVRESSENGSASAKNRRAIIDAIPWERAKRNKLPYALYQTILRVMFNAPRFFSSLPAAHGSLKRPAAFYVILGVFQTLIEHLWFYLSLRAANPSLGDPHVQELLGTMLQNLSLPLTLILAPLLLMLQIFFFAGIFFLMVRLVQPDRVSFSVIFRVVAYSAAPTVLCVIPIVGPVAGSLWFAICCLAGCHYALELSWTKTLLALGPLYAIAFAIGLQVAKQMLGA